MPFARPIVARTAAALDRSGRWAAAAGSGYLLGVGVPSALRFSLISMRLRSDCERRGGPTFSDTGISGFLSGHDRREVHAKAET